MRRSPASSASRRRPRRTLARQEALEAEAARRVQQPAADERDRSGERPGHDLDAEALRRPRARRAARRGPTDRACPASLATATTSPERTRSSSPGATSSSVWSSSRTSFGARTPRWCSRRPVRRVSSHATTDGDGERRSGTRASGRPGCRSACRPGRADRPAASTVLTSGPRARRRPRRPTRRTRPRAPRSPGGRTSTGGPVGPGGTVTTAAPCRPPAQNATSIVKRMPTVCTARTGSTSTPSRWSAPEQAATSFGAGAGDAGVRQHRACRGPASRRSGALGHGPPGRPSAQTLKRKSTTSPSATS